MHPSKLPPYMGPFTKKIHRRLLLCFGIFCLLCSLLYLRIGLLGQSSQLAQTAARQSKYTLTPITHRGTIYDRYFQPLVDLSARTVNVVLPGAANAGLLEQVPGERRSQVAELFERGTPFLLEDMQLEPLPGVYSFDTTSRYLEDQPAAHLIGYLDNEGNGISGIEKSYDDLLKSYEQKIQVVCTLDGLQQPISGLEPEIRITGSSGGGVVLTLDREIQQIVEEVGSEMLDKGAIVVMDPYSGDILASASFPTYSPLNLADSVQDAENTPMINRALLPYSVGSTFKIVTTAAALEAGADMTEIVDCTGWVDVSGQIFRCHNRSGHGPLDMLDALKESCNPYFIHLGLEVGGEAMAEMAARFGFGQSVKLAEGLTMSGGSCPAAADLVSPAAVANLSFGQGILSASPVQIARMMAAAVNGGYLVTPRLVLGETADGERLQRNAGPLSKQILSSEIAAQLQTFLIHCVMVSEGQNALPQTVTAGGKTATAQTGQFYEEGNELEHGWFAGFFPAVNPEYVVVVLSENSGFGNTTAAPVFSQLADRITAAKNP